MHAQQTGTDARDLIRILLAEDYDINRKIVRRILEPAGYRVDAVGNGRLALEAYKALNYHCILMDLEMPEMDGYTATRKIREWEAAVGNQPATGNSAEAHSDPSATSETSLRRSAIKSVPIIAMTGHPVASVIETCLTSGMNDCVSKPMQREGLLAIIRKWTAAATDSPIDVSPAAEPVQLDVNLRLPLDIDRAVTEFMGQREVLAGLLRTFIERIGEQLSVIRRAMACRDFKMIASQAHSIKGGAANLTADRLAAVAAELESAADSQEQDNMSDLPEKLEQEYQRLKDYLRQNRLMAIPKE